MGVGVGGAGTSKHLPNEPEGCPVFSEAAAAPLGCVPFDLHLTRPRLGAIAVSLSFAVRAFVSLSRGRLAGTRDTTQARFSPLFWRSPHVAVDGISPDGLTTHAEPSATGEHTCGCGSAPIAARHERMLTEQERELDNSKNTGESP